MHEGVHAWWSVAFVTCWVRFESALLYWYSLVNSAGMMQELTLLGAALIGIFVCIAGGASYHWLCCSLNIIGSGIEG